MKNDFRNVGPRFSQDARRANQALIDRLTSIAAEKKVTPAQVALAWLLARKPWIVPIPGTTKPARLEENAAAEAIELTAREARDVADALAQIKVVGERYPAQMAAMIDR